MKTIVNILMTLAILMSSSTLFSQSTKTVNLHLFLEGLYIGSNTMRPAMNASGYQWGETVADKITVDLYDAPNYSGVVYSLPNVVLNTNGNTTFTLPDTYNGSYYITVRHRNHIQASTKLPVSFSSSTITYNFDTTSKVYGHNMHLLTDGGYAFHAGDVNQDGLIDGSDLAVIANKNDVFATGYLVEDITGDGLVDGSDLAITNNNNEAFIRLLTPDMPLDGQPCSGTPILLDVRDGKSYITVKIGTQCWMAQNLNIGTRIPGYSDQTNNGIIEKYCYSNVESNCNIYGGLYQWNEAMQYSTTPGDTGICPAGWHLPTYSEWTTLTDFLGGETIAGGKIKSTGTIQAGTGLWNSPNTGATNLSNFTAFPGGRRYPGGSFVNLANYAYFWSSSQYDATYSFYIYLYYQSELLSRISNSRIYGFSCRCIKD